MDPTRLQHLAVGRSCPDQRNYRLRAFPPDDDRRMDFTLRAATPEMLPFFAELAARAGYDGHAAFTSPEEARRWLEEFGSAEQWEQRLRAYGVLIGAWQDEQLLGMAGVVNGYVSVYCRTRGKGLGGFLVDRICSLGLDSLKAEIHSFNLPSQRIFISRGFVYVSEEPSTIFAGEQMRLYERRAEATPEEVATLMLGFRSPAPLPTSKTSDAVTETPEPSGDEPDAATVTALMLGLEQPRP